MTRTQPSTLCGCSVTHSCPALCNPMICSTPGFPVLLYLLELTQTHVHRVGDAIRPSHPLSSPSPPAFNCSQHQGLFHESVICIQWPKYWCLSLSISPSNEYSGLISFRIHWFDLFAVQGTLKSLLQHHSLNSLVLSCLYGTTLTSIRDHWRDQSLWLVPLRNDLFPRLYSWSFRNRTETFLVWTPLSVLRVQISVCRHLWGRFGRGLLR